MIKEPALKYLEDFTPGETETIDGYLVTAEEIIDFAKKWDPQPMHIDPVAAQTSNYGGLIASGAHLMAIAVRQLVARPTRIATIGVLALEQVRFLEPARPGDFITLVRECIEVRPSNSRSDRGVVRNQVTLNNQYNKHLLTYTDVLLVARYPSAIVGK